MENKTFYHEILTDHNLHPAHKHDLHDADYVLEGVNPNCGDDIWLKVKMNDGHFPGVSGYDAGFGYWKNKGRCTSYDGFVFADDSRGDNGE